MVAILKVEKAIAESIMFDPKGRWYVGRTNLLRMVRAPLTPPKKVIVKDETLREGEETPGVALTLDEKLKVAKKLQEAGVQEIEVGYPSVSDRDFKFAKLLRDEVKMKLVAHGRGWAKNWKEEIDRLVKCEVDVVTFVQLGPVELVRAPYLQLSDIPEMTRKCVRYAKDNGLFTAFFLHSAGRTSLDLVESINLAAIEAGADRIYAAGDGAGCLIPETAAFLTRFIADIAEMKGFKPQLAVHCHNDFGLATANTLAAVNAGTEVIDLVVNGLGDRAGNASLEEVVCALEVLYQVKTGIKIEKLYELSKLVEKLYKVKVQPNKAIVGENAYRHSTDDHISTILRGEWYLFENIKPEVLKRSRSLEFGLMATQKGSDSALPTKIEKMGLTYTEKQLDEIIKKVNKIALERTFATEKEVETIIRNVVKRLEQ